MKTNIRYKVVSLSRTSCLVPFGSKYCLKYERGQIVKKVPGSFGIMVFKNKKHADHFKKIITENMLQSFIIIKVETMGRAKHIDSLCYLPTRNYIATRSFNIFYKFYNEHKRKKNWSDIFVADHTVGLMSVPNGTECYPAVKILS